MLEPSEAFLLLLIAFLVAPLAFIGVVLALGKAFYLLAAARRRRRARGFVRRLD